MAQTHHDIGKQVFIIIIIILHTCLKVSQSLKILAGWQPGEKQLFGGWADIFANNTVISPWRAKHASVCLLIPHKRTAHSSAFIHKQRQTFSLLCRLVSFSFFHSPPSFLSEPGEAHTLTHSPRNKPGGLWTTHTEQWLFFLFLLPFLPPYLLSHPHCFGWSLSLYHFHFFINLSPFLCTSPPLSPAWP